MKKKIYRLLSLITLLFILTQIYFHLSNNGNTTVIIFGQHREKEIKSLVIINNIVVDTVNINNPIIYIDSYRMVFGRNDIEVREIDSGKKYKVTMCFIGLYTWNSMDIFQNGDVFHQRYYYPKGFD